ncbi:MULTISPECIES: hypothetical protein [Pseudofrankia]|uniref:hypothetical protein n=1 Tax=Pseudofrankia TaxID=2994363 RepID=UPI001E2C47A7|nr:MULTISPECIES: hypothetical protein [Pseudofrankia]
MESPVTPGTPVVHDEWLPVALDDEELQPITVDAATRNAAEAAVWARSRPRPAAFVAP